jgi:hypothetical protein
LTRPSGTACPPLPAGTGNWPPPCRPSSRRGWIGCPAVKETLQLAAGKATRVHSLAEARRYYDAALALLDTKRLSAPDQRIYIDLSLKWAEVSQYSPSNKIRTSLIHSLE